VIESIDDRVNLLLMLSGVSMLYELKLFDLPSTIALLCLRRAGDGQTLIL